jgi:hypothetical protein
VSHFAEVWAMRTFLISLLLAGVASPVLAAAPDRDRHGQREDRAERKADKAERQAEKPQRNAEPRNVERAAPQRVAEPRNLEGPGPALERRNVESTRRNRGFDAPGGGERPRRNADVDVRQARGTPESGFARQPQEVVEERRVVDSVREWRRRERVQSADVEAIEQRNVRSAPRISESGDLVQQRRPAPRVFDRAERRISRRPILGTEPPPPRTATAIAARPARHWSSHWRNDRRYDWRDWRRRHRSRFHFGFYSDPFGWDYFRYGIGWRLWPSYYRSSYWLNDPWEYRLPPAYGPYRWVRYYNDALLVNIYTGQVVDVEYNFFW